MPSRIEKLEAYASHLLDSMIALREKFALLEPMLFSEEVPKSRGSGRQSRGFKILRHTLFLSCAQDIAKLSLDGDKRTPSIKNIIDALQDRDLRDKLLERYAALRTPFVDEEHDPEILEALKRFEIQEEAENRATFKHYMDSLESKWAEITTSPTLIAFSTIRDKVSAHTEVRYLADKYQLVDISTLGIKWSDIGVTVRQLQEIVELIGLVVRNASFAWEMLDQQLTRAAKYFWLE